MQTLDFTIAQCLSMKKYPDPLWDRGNRSLLDRRLVSIVGSRRPSPYAIQQTHRLAQQLSHVGIAIVSGAAMGIDASAHRGAGAANTIAVLPGGIDIRYPSVNKNLLAEIESKGLLLSQFEPGFRPTNWSFVVRNELVVALGEVLIVAQAETQSGSMRSVEYALEMGKPVYVLPHRIGESEGTNRLLAEGKAQPIYDVEAFVRGFAPEDGPLPMADDPFMTYCKTFPTYEEAVLKFAERVFEAELNGEIEVRNGRIYRR